MRATSRVRQVVNVVNLATPLGLLLALALRARVERTADGILLARGARGSFPRADAFTIGDVVLLRVPEPSAALLAHEARHSTQWAYCVVLFLPLYLVAVAWSWLRCGDHWSRNWFERGAVLVDGGYVEHPPRRWRRR